jgi:hypothetical protein
VSTTQVNQGPAQSVSRYQARQRRMNLALYVVGFVLGTAMFLMLDWFRTAAMARSTAKKPATTCNVPDPVRRHAFKPNCAVIDHWGKDYYEFFTNSLGFRDERIRQVPLADPRPRILMLGDSQTEGKLAWHDSFVGQIATHFPQYEFLNGGSWGYSPSNYLNVARMVLGKGVEFDEAIVIIDITDVQDEAAFYQDVASSGAVVGPAQTSWTLPWSAKWRFVIAKHLVLTNYIFEFFDRFLVRHGYYHSLASSANPFGNPFDMEYSAWTYRKVNETEPFMVGYAPLGVEGGIAKERAKMTLLWQELEKRNIPLSVVVDLHPAQMVHDTADSRQVRIWREWCDGKCKRFISLFPVFFAAKDQCPRNEPGCWYLNLFVFGDVHYNAAGNALIADTIIKSLTEQPPTKRQLEASGRDSAKHAGGY